MATVVVVVVVDDPIVEQQSSCSSVQQQQFSWLARGILLLFKINVANLKATASQSGLHVSHVGCTSG